MVLQYFQISCGTQYYITQVLPVSNNIEILPNTTSD